MLQMAFRGKQGNLPFPQDDQIPYILRAALFSDDKRYVPSPVNYATYAERAFLTLWGIKGGLPNNPSIDVSPRKLTPHFSMGHFAGL